VNNVAVIFFVALALGIIAFTYLVERRRAAAIRTVATQYGFHYLGTALPRSLTLGGTSLERMSSVWNVVDGEPHGTRLVVFDCRVGVDKGSWRRTVFAWEDDAESPSFVTFNQEWAVERSGRWTILYRPKEHFEMRIGSLMPVSELQAYLGSMQR
jgi:hypothetical protein